MDCKKRVAFLVLGVGESFGGAERFFANLFDRYETDTNTKFQLYFITDQQSVDNFKTFNLLKFSKKIIVLPTWNNRFKKYLEFFYFFFTVLIFRINIIHIPVYGVQHFYNLKYLSRIKSIFPIKIIVNIEDCRVAYAYSETNNLYDFTKELRKKYNPLFSSVKMDAIYTWYQLFKKQFEKNTIIPSLPIIESANYCFADLKRFNPIVNKKNQIIYAARLESQKKPMLFLQAIYILKTEYPDMLKDWNVIFVGYGSLEKEAKEYIHINDLSRVVSFQQTLDLSSLYNESKCFVSTQDFENFTSLSMLEAMAAGNAIVSRNVGQTNYFVKDGVNGILSKEDNANGLAEAILFFIQHPELHSSMMNESVRLATHIHTAENFIKDIEQFWTKVIEK